MRTYMAVKGNEGYPFLAQNYADVIEKAKQYLGDFDYITHIPVTKQKEQLSDEIRLALYESKRKVAK